MSRALTVFWDDLVVGTLRIDEHGDMRFAYTQDWVHDAACRAISYSLPKQIEEFGRRQTRPFFAGLLPEERPRDAVARLVGVSERNDYALLEALGGDVAGALSLWEPGQVPPPPQLEKARILSDDELIATLDELPRRPMLVGEDGIRMSLAGAQVKLPVVVIDGAIALPGPGQPTTHILKPPIEKFPHTTANEAFALRLAALVGLQAANVEPRRIRDREFLLVERYDRLTADGVVRRLHQEDFCQALGKSPEHKYAKEGGPNFPDSFKLVREATAKPALDVLRLLNAAIFNLAIGNADAHGKNFSLLYRPSGLTLAPLYDLMSTAIYLDVATNLAMQFAKTSNIAELTEARWDKFAASCALGPSYVRNQVKRMCALIGKHAPTAAERLGTEGFQSETLDEIVVLVTDRSVRIADAARQ